MWVGASSRWYEMYIAGVSVRRVEDITEALWGTRVSPSTISNLNKKIYSKIEEWRNHTNGYSLQPTCAQSRMPMDRIVSGACVSFFHASHAASTMAS